MTGVERRWVLRVAKGIDLVLCAVALLAATHFIWHLSLSRLVLVGLSHPAEVLSLGALLVVWHLCLSGLGAYQSHRLNGNFREAGVIVRALLLCSVATVVETSLVGPASGPGQSAVILSAAFLMLSIVLLGSSRLIGRAFFRRLRRRDMNLRNVLIVGTNRRALALARSLETETGWGYRLSGFVDDHWQAPCVSEHYITKLLGNLADLPALLRTVPLDEVIIVLPIASFYQQSREVIQQCATHGLLVRYEASLFDLEHRNPSGTLSRFVTVHSSSWNNWARALKRLLDIIASFTLLLVFSPILALVALLIRFTSPGPIFFVQERLGVGKRKFRMFKFRTMVVDAEKKIAELAHLNQSNGPTFKLKHDPRITRFGNLLRSTSLDELPQLYNVLRGDMSLVGPRPLPMRDYAGFEQDSHRRPFSVKPGLTCLWQIAGRSSIGFEQWMELDLDYIDQWSLWLDLRILAQTVPAVLRRSGAM